MAISCVGPRDVLFGTPGMPCMRLGASGRQAAVGAGPCSRQPAGCAPAPHSTRESRREGRSRALRAASRRSAPPVPPCARGSPVPVPAVLGAGPSCACSWQKHLSRGRAAHICPSASQPCPAIPVRASAPSQLSPRPRTRGEQEWSLSVPDEGCWPLAMFRAGALLCHRGGVCWLRRPSIQQPSFCHPSPSLQPLVSCPRWCRLLPREGGRGIGL